MDLDLDLFERKHRRSDDRRYRRDRGRRRSRPHLFSWVFLAGGVILLVAALLGIAASFGLWEALSGGYFSLTTALLPESWHDEWVGLPGIAHLAIVFGALFVAAGALGEIFD